MLQYVIPFTHRSECRLETPLCNSVLWNCHTGCISLKPCIIDCKCRTVVKFLSLGKVQALQIWSALFAVRGSQPEALCISFSLGQGKSDLAPVLLSSSERRAGNCRRSGQQQRRGSGYPTPWGCNTNKTANKCVSTFHCAFSPCIFSYSPSVSCLCSQAGCSCLSPCHGTRWH